jgi:hypothetical protein
MIQNIKLTKHAIQNIKSTKFGIYKYLINKRL